MTANPYQAPKSETVPNTSAKSRPILGVIAGLVVDVGGTLIVALVLGLLAVLVLGPLWDGPANVSGRLLSTNPFSVANLALLAIGTFMSYLGGWVCSRVGRARDLGPGVVLAALIALFNAVTVSDSEPLVLSALLIAAGVAATMLGAHKGLAKLPPSRADSVA